MLKLGKRANKPATLFLTVQLAVRRVGRTLATTDKNLVKTGNDRGSCTPRMLHLVLQHSLSFVATLIVAWRADNHRTGGDLVLALIYGNVRR
jgi:hypothetical protein